MTATLASRETAGDPGQRDRFADVLRAEWTKFRTVRGWVIGMIVAALLMVVLGTLLAGGVNIGCLSGPDSTPKTGLACLPKIPLGPGGEPVYDSYYLVSRPVAGDGSITVRITSLTGQLPPGAGPVQAGAAGQSGVDAWAKAGLIITASARQGSAYAAIMVTGQHGIRLQDDYTGDIAGPAVSVTKGSPRWLRLTRSGDTITGSASADGTHWTTVGTVRLSGLATARAGLFVTSPDFHQVVSQSIGSSHGIGGPTVATAAFDHLSASGTWSAGQLTGKFVGSANASNGQPGDHPGFRRSGSGYTVTGTGDIAPVVPDNGSYPTVTLEQSLAGAFLALIAIGVVAAMFMTAEYRRGLIRITFAASPRRGRVLAAKAIVLAAVSFAAGLVASVICVIVGPARLHSQGAYVFPDSALTEIRIVAGTAALLAVVAVLALALATLARRSAVAITAIIAGVVLPYVLAVAQILPAGPADWLLRVTPAAGFAIQQSVSAYPQVAASYTPANGYFPLSPLAGFAVLCGFAAAAMALAAYLLHRRDA